MRNYIRKSSGLEASLHYRVWAILRDYERMRCVRANILYGSAAQADGTPRNPAIGNPTEKKALQLAAVSREVDAVDQTCMQLRGEYSGKVYYDFDPIKAYWEYAYFNYVHLRTGNKPNGPTTRTWGRYRDKFAKILLEKLNFI